MNIKLLKSFRDEEDGGIVAFTLIMFMVMVVGGGMAVDFMNQESRRAAVQDALDRGVLAATSNAQAAIANSPDNLNSAEAAAIATVRSYLTISGFDPDALGVNIVPDFSLTTQRVDVSSSFSVDTYFLRMTGIEALGGQAVSAASTGSQNIEISLVLDVSGSMNFDVNDGAGNFLGRRIDLLQSAATDFTSTLLEGRRPSYTSISVVPFSGQVALPDYMAQLYPNFDTVSRWQNYSNCMLFDDSDYRTTNFSQFAAPEQYQHFYLLAGRAIDSAGEIIESENVLAPACPDASSQILPLANDVEQINAMINNLTPQSSTNTWSGIKWGTNLLDSSAQAVVRSMTQTCSNGVCLVDPRFRGRPAAYNDTTTLKFIVAMTDGANDKEVIVPLDGYNVYGSAEANTQQNAAAWEYYRTVSEPNVGADYFLKDEDTGEYFPEAIRTSAAEGDDLMQDVCTAAKNQGIVIFTIGVDIAEGSNPYNQMRSCASSPGDFYSVGSANLADAFDAITTTIQKLRLVN